MPEVTPALLQAGLLFAVAWLTRSRLLVVAFAFAAAVATIALGYPASITKPPEALVADLIGVFVGLAIGWFIAASRQPKARTRQQREALMETDGSLGRRRAGWMVAVFVLLATAGTALWLEGPVPESWRSVAKGWVGAVTAATGGAASTHTAAATTAPNAAPAAGKSGGSGASGAAAPGSRAGTATERPTGDVRHCLDQSSAAAVARCAEKAR